MPFLACWAIAALASLLFQRFSMRESYIETPSPVCGGGVVVLLRLRAFTGAQGEGHNSLL